MGTWYAGQLVSRCGVQLGQTCVTKSTGPWATATRQVQLVE